MDCAFDSIILSSRVKYLQYLFHEIVETKMARLNCIIILISIASCVLAEELYSDQYDHIDVNNILSNDKLRNQYVNCYMETEPCLTADAKFFRDIASEAFQTKCEKCTEKQKEMMDTVVDWYTQNKPDEWQKIVAKSLEDMKKKNAGQ